MEGAETPTVPPGRRQCESQQLAPFYDNWRCFTSYGESPSGLGSRTREVIAVDGRKARDGGLQGDRGSPDRVGAMFPLRKYDSDVDVETEDIFYRWTWTEGSGQQIHLPGPPTEAVVSG